MLIDMLGKWVRIKKVGRKVRLGLGISSVVWVRVRHLIHCLEIRILLSFYMQRF